ncbi:MAG TPA: ABC transporter permease subunit [Candidatus Paceibacterota bacterium]
MRELFELRGSLSTKKSILLGISGGILVLLFWFYAWNFGLVRRAILPSPAEVFYSFPDLFQEDHLVSNVSYSVFLNFLGYLEAVLIALPLGLVVGLIPSVRKIAEPYISALRYTPLSATLGLFISAFGLGSNMKIQFLTLGLLVYLVPQTVSRVDEVEEVYVQTVRTLGASKWQTITSVFIPAVVSRVFGDIRVLLGISWTYIIMAEIINMSDGGIGALAYKAARQSRPDKVYAVLMVIMIIGFLQDKISGGLDRLLFRYKYA